MAQEKKQNQMEEHRTLKMNNIDKWNEFRSRRTKAIHGFIEIKQHFLRANIFRK